MLNKVLLIGNVGNDPEAGTLPDGREVTNLRMATSHRWRDKATGEQQEKTTWHSIAFYGPVARVAAQYALKGRQIYVEGRIEEDKYTAKDGSVRYATRIIASDLKLLGSKPGGGESAPQGQSHEAVDELPADGEVF